MKEVSAYLLYRLHTNDKTMTQQIGKKQLPPLLNTLSIVVSALGDEEVSDCRHLNRFQFVDEMWEKKIRFNIFLYYDIDDRK